MAMYMHKETGSVDTREGWIASYDAEELEARGLTAEEAFAEDEGTTLFEVIDPASVDKDKMTRDEAIALVGLAAVKDVEAETCEPTSRAYDHADGEIEWSASVKVDYDTLAPHQIDALPIGGCRLTAIYYTDADDAAAVEASGGDWGGISWAVHHYAIG